MFFKQLLRGKIPKAKKDNDDLSFYACRHFGEIDPRSGSRSIELRGFNKKMEKKNYFKLDSN